MLVSVIQSTNMERGERGRAGDREMGGKTERGEVREIKIWEGR
jgi:hypothetical protein